jgi:hypothetical protein
MSHIIKLTKIHFYFTNCFLENIPIRKSRLCYTVPKAVHISQKYLGVYMGPSPLVGKFPKAV